MIENKQKPVAGDYDPDGKIKIHSHFLTIQGEGPFCGQRALFIRLHGCNLRCPGCDTDYTSTMTAATDGRMLRLAQEHLPVGGLVVITGGEPLRQNIVPSIKRLLEANYRVQIESNGVLFPEGLEELFFVWGAVGCKWQPGKVPARLSLVVSPKTSRIHDKAHRYAIAFKYVLQADNVDEDGLPLRALRHPAAPRVARPPGGAPVYVQPMDEADPVANKRNLAAAIASVMAHGHTLQLQVHKIINME
jgi:organic radical activating enzyme